MADSKTSEKIDLNTPLDCREPTNSHNLSMAMVAPCRASSPTDISLKVQPKLELVNTDASAHKRDEKTQALLPFGNSKMADASIVFHDTAIKVEVRAEGLAQRDHALGPKMDPKKLKRILSNRASAQKSRLRKFQYVAELERKIKVSEVEIAMLSNQLALYGKQYQKLRMEQETLKQQLLSYETVESHRAREIAENKAQVQMLRQLIAIQNQQRQQMQEMMNKWNLVYGNTSSVQTEENTGMITNRWNQTIVKQEQRGEGSLVWSMKDLEPIRMVPTPPNRNIDHRSEPWHGTSAIKPRDHLGLNLGNQ